VVAALLKQITPIHSDTVVIHGADAVSGYGFGSRLTTEHLRTWKYWAPNPDGRATPEPVITWLVSASKWATTGRTADARGGYWWFQDRLYRGDSDLTPSDVEALALETQNRKRLQIEKAHALKAMVERLDEHGRRQTIPREIKQAVWQRDRGACVACGSSARLEFDHVIPHSLGGSDTERNLQLLCADCNRRKGATLGGEDPGRPPSSPTGESPRAPASNGPRVAQRSPERRPIPPWIVRCPSCGTQNRVRRGSNRARCGKCATLFTPALASARS